MWMLIKNELKYNWAYTAVPLIGLLTYTILAILDFELPLTSDFEIDYWVGMLSFILYAFLIGFWGNRIKEKRNRLLTTLPISIKEISLLRFSLSVTPFVFLTLYLLFVHLVIIDNWQYKSGDMIGQVGITLILFAAFIKTRDDWFSHWNLGKRFQKAFVSMLVIQILVVVLFLTLDDYSENMRSFFGEDSVNYLKLIYSLLGYTLLTTTIYSYRKRRMFLS